jgi:hypothetical protein
MAVRHLEAEVRQERGVVVLDLRGEINGFAQEAGGHPPQLRGG